MTALQFHPGSALPAWALRLGKLMVTIALLASFTLETKGQKTTADEYEIRAAMLFNLTKFIDWPASKFDPAHPQFLVCILGSDPIAPFADRFLHKQNVGGKLVQVLHLSSLEAANTCHILYLGSSERTRGDHVLPELIKNGVLTVSERANDANPNQVIGLPTIEEHVRIEVNLGVAQRSGLTISSKLLRLAAVTR